MLGVFFLIASASPSNAYVDPGSASLVVTAVLGAFASISYTALVYWKRLTSFWLHFQSFRLLALWFGMAVIGVVLAFAWRIIDAQKWFSFAAA
jgi:hypothetical protein